MGTMARTFWQDDAGAIIAAEFLFIATILVIGVIVGFAAVRDAINTEFAELSNSYLALSQGYVLYGQAGCCSMVDGSQAIDTPVNVPETVCTAPVIPSPIDQIPCN